MRITAQQRGVQADPQQHLCHIILLLVPPDQSVHHRRLADDIDHAHARVERGIGILENHLDLELDGALFVCRQSRDLFAAPQARACGRLEQADGETR